MLAFAAVGSAGVQDDPQVAKPAQHARIPLEKITGATAPQAVTVTPLADVPEIAEAIEQAQAGIEDGRFMDTAEILEDVLEQPGAQRHEIFYMLALAKTRLGMFDDVHELAEQAARYGHGDANTHYLMAQIYQREGENTSAIAHYRSTTLAAERELNNPKVTRAWYSLGRLLEQQGYQLAAAQAFEQFDKALWQTHVEQRNAPDMATLLAGHPHGMVPDRIQLLLDLECFEDALNVTRWAREVWPDDLAIITQHAEMLIAAGHPDQAFEFCHARLHNPEMSEALLPIAIESARVGNRLGVWIEELTEQAESGTSLDMARGVAYTLVSAGYAREASPLLRTLLNKLPGDQRLAWVVSAEQQRMGDLSAALDTLLACIRHNPEAAHISPQQLFVCKSWFSNSGDLAETVKVFRARSDADFASDYLLGACALAVGDLPLAEELLQACLSMRPGYTPAILVRGEMLLGGYQWESALEYAEEILEENPKLPAAHYLKARGYAGLDQNDDAEQSYKRAIKYASEEPTYLLDLARHYRRLGNLRGAQRYYQETLAVAPANGEALEGLMDSYLRGGKIEIAQKRLEQLDRNLVPADTLRRVNTLMRFLSDPFGTAHLAELQSQWDRYPNDIDTARLLAGGLYFRGRYAETRDVIDQALAKQPNDYHLTVLLANVHSIQGRFDKAVSLLEGLARRYPNRLAIVQPLALANMNDFRLEPGRELLRRLMDLDPEQADRYRVQLLRSYVEFTECDQAYELVESWIEAEPDKESLIYNKIAVLIDCQRTDEAFEIVKLRLEEDPSDQRRLEFLEYGQQTRHFEEVVERLRTWLEKNPNNATLCQYLIDALLQVDKPGEALEAARKFEGTYSESFRRRIWMGRCQAALGEAEKALAEFDALLGERGVGDDEKREVRWQIVSVLHDAGQIDEALDLCDRWMSTGKQDRILEYESLFNKRWLLQAAGRDEECALVMEKLLEFRPDDVGIFNDLGYTWVDLGINLDRATEMIKTAVATEPWNAAYLDSLGWAYYKAGDFANAHKYLSRAVRLRAGQDPVLYDHLADAACRLGDLKTARKYWKAALTMLETDSSEEIQKLQTDLLAQLRGKLDMLDRSVTPDAAPTADEQSKE